MLRSTPGVQFGPRRVRTPSTYLSTPAQHRLQARSAWPKECLPSLFLLFESEPEHNCQWVKYPFGLPDATTVRRDDEKSSARRVRPARAHRPPGNSQCSGARPSRREDRAPLRAAARPAAPAGTARQQRHRVPPRAPGGGATQPSAPHVGRKAPARALSRQLSASEARMRSEQPTPLGIGARWCPLCCWQMRRKSLPSDPARARNRQPSPHLLRMEASPGTSAIAMDVIRRASIPLPPQLRRRGKR